MLGIIAFEGWNAAVPAAGSAAFRRRGRRDDARQPARTPAFRTDMIAGLILI